MVCLPVMRIHPLVDAKISHIFALPVTILRFHQSMVPYGKSSIWVTFSFAHRITFIVGTMPLNIAPNTSTLPGVHSAHRKPTIAVNIAVIPPFLIKVAFRQVTCCGLGGCDNSPFHRPHATPTYRHSTSSLRRLLIKVAEGSWSATVTARFQNCEPSSAYHDLIHASGSHPTPAIIKRTLLFLDKPLLLLLVFHSAALPPYYSASLEFIGVAARCRFSFRLCWP